VDKQQVIFKDLGTIDYSSAWEIQEKLLQENVAVKMEARKNNIHINPNDVTTTHHLLFCEHPPVYTLGKSGKESNLLISDEELHNKGIELFKTNRGGDITFHGLEQIVGYPIFDLEKFSTDIGIYLRNIEEVIIRTLLDYNIKAERSIGETGVWIDAAFPLKARKICAIGVRCSRWITMHGFALNVNTDLSYFENIIPCGIQDKKVTSIKKELGSEIDIVEVKKKLQHNFEEIFQIQIA